MNTETAHQSRLKAAYDLGFKSGLAGDRKQSRSEDIEVRESFNAGWIRGFLKWSRKQTGGRE